MTREDIFEGTKVLVLSLPGGDYGSEGVLTEGTSEPEEDPQSDQVQAVLEIQLVAIGMCRN